MIEIDRADIAVICGKRRSGKSHFTKALIKGFKRRIIFDTNWEHDDMGARTSSFAGMQALWSRGLTHVVFQPTSKEPDYFDAFMHEIMEKYRGVNVTIEEIENYETTHKTTVWFKRCLDIGRHRDIGLVCTVRRIPDMNASIGANADHIFVFKTHRPQDLELLSKWIGEEVYKIQTAPEYSFVYYNDREGTTELKEKI